MSDQASRGAEIDFSAQFGGRDAAECGLPHFHALKRAREGIRIKGFPFAELAFILRVDGSVSSYGFSGLGAVEIDRKGEYLAIDIGITEADREHIRSTINDAISASVEVIERTTRQQGLGLTNSQSLAASLSQVRQNYLGAAPQAASASSTHSG